jgi:hypothetical protein
VPGALSQCYLPYVQRSRKLSVFTLLHVQNVSELRPVLDQMRWTSCAHVLWCAWEGAPAVTPCA